MRTFFHVTERNDADAILASGFEGGWGDAGFGVYVFGNELSARQYAAVGGWDGRLEDPVILAINTDDVALVIPDPGWPNPEDYADVYWHEMDEDENGVWRPDMALLSAAKPSVSTPGL